MQNVSSGRLSIDRAKRLHLVQILADNSTSMHPRIQDACKGLAAAADEYREGENILRSAEQDGDGATIRVSLRWLNGDWHSQEAHPDDFAPPTVEGYQCHGKTPLVGQSLLVLSGLVSRVKEYREQQGIRARGHLIWFSDGEATDMGDEASLAELKNLVSALVNPFSADGEKANQVIDLYAIPIGPQARSFYETIGVPAGHIFDVPEELGVPFVKAMQRASLLKASKVFEFPGDAFVRIMNAARKKRPSERLHWWPTKNPNVS